MIVAGSSPATILQKMQSGSDTSGSLSIRAEEFPRPVDRLGARGELAREARLLERCEHTAQLRPRPDSQLARELVAAQRRAGWICNPPQRLSQQLLRERDVLR